MSVTQRIARIQDKHYLPVLTVDVATGYSEAEDGVILTIARDGAVADKNPKDAGDAMDLRTVGITFADAKVLAKALTKAVKNA